MPFTRQLEVYVHPLHPPLTPGQLERRALFSHHFGSSLPLPFVPRQGKPSRDPPPFPFWFPAPERLVSASETHYASASSSSLGGGVTTATASHPAAAGQSRSPTSCQGKSSSAQLPSQSSTFSFFAPPLSSSFSSVDDYSSLRLFPGYSYTDGATYSSPPGHRLCLHYLSQAEGALKCRTQVRSDGLRFDATGNKLLVAAREHVMLINVADVALDRCISCPGATIVLPHQINPDLIAVAGQEAYQQSPYVRLYDVRLPTSTGKSSTSRSSSSSSSSSVADTSPVMEMWGPRHDGWWSACWCPTEEKIVCVDRKDVLHVFSLSEGIRRSSRAVRIAVADSVSRGGSAVLSTSSPNGSTKSSASSGSAGLNKRSAAAADIGDHSHMGSMHENTSSGTMRAKTPFSSTPGSGVGKVSSASAARSGDAVSAISSDMLSENWGISFTSSSNKRSSTSPPGTSSPPPVGVSSSSTSSSHYGSTATGGPQPSDLVYIHQLKGIANACTFHPSGEFLLVAQDNGSLLILAFDAASTQDPLMKRKGVKTINGLQAVSSSPFSIPSAGAPSLPVPPSSATATAEDALSLSLRLHQGGMTCCAADPSGRFVATGGSSSERNVLVLNADTMDVVGEIGRTEGGLQAMSFSFDGQFLAWGCRDPASSSTAIGVLGRGAGGDSSSYGGGRGLESSTEEKQETFLTIAGTDPCEIYLQCATPAAVSAVAFHPNRYICAFATEGDTTAAGAQQQIRQGIGGTTFWTKPQHPLQQYHLGFFSFE